LPEQLRIPAVIKRTLQKYVDTRLAREAMEPTFKKLEADEDVLAARLNNLLGEFQFKSIDIDGLGQFIRSRRGPYCSYLADETDLLVAEDDIPESGREAVVKWAEKEGLRDTLIKETVIFPRLNSIYSARLHDEKGPSLPPVEARYVDGITWRNRPEAKRDITKKQKVKRVK